MLWSSQNDQGRTPLNEGALHRDSERVDIQESKESRVGTLVRSEIVNDNNLLSRVAVESLEVVRVNSPSPSLSSPFSSEPGLPASCTSSQSVHTQCGPCRSQFLVLDELLDGEQSCIRGHLFQEFRNSKTSIHAMFDSSVVVKLLGYRTELSKVTVLGAIGLVLR